MSAVNKVLVAAFLSIFLQGNRVMSQYWSRVDHQHPSREQVDQKTGHFVAINFPRRRSDENNLSAYFQKNYLSQLPVQKSYNNDQFRSKQLITNDNGEKNSLNTLWSSSTLTYIGKNFKMLNRITTSPTKSNTLEWTSRKLWPTRITPPIKDQTEPNFLDVRTSGTEMIVPEDNTEPNFITDDTTIPPETNAYFKTQTESNQEIPTTEFDTTIPPETNAYFETQTESNQEITTTEFDTTIAPETNAYFETQTESNQEITTTEFDTTIPPETNAYFKTQTESNQEITTTELSETTPSVDITMTTQPTIDQTDWYSTTERTIEPASSTKQPCPVAYCNPNFEYYWQ